MSTTEGYTFPPTAAPAPPGGLAEVSAAAPGHATAAGTGGGHTPELREQLEGFFQHRGEAQQQQQPPPAGA